MLTRNDRQEALSRAYVRAVAAMAGVICTEPEQDYGVDLCLRRVRHRGNRHADAGSQVDLQLRSTTKFVDEENHFKYDLDVVTFDDLRLEGDNVPRFLVVLRLPAEEGSWLEQSIEQLILRRCAYWVSLVAQKATSSTTTTRITIPKSNVFSVEAIGQLLDSVRRKER